MAVKTSLAAARAARAAKTALIVAAALLVASPAATPAALPAAAPANSALRYNQSRGASLGNETTAGTAAASLRDVNHKKMATLGGRPAPLLWADGIDRLSDLPLYKSLGLNTVVVRLVWRSDGDGGLVVADLDGPRAFAEGAAAAGLQIIYSLPPAPAGMERNFRTSADSEAYFLLWSSWVADAVKSLRTTPNLFGWMLPNDPRALRYADDIGFTRWLKANFADPTVLNRQWNTNFASFDEVTIGAVQSLAATAKTGVADQGDMNTAQLAARVQASRLKEDNQPFDFHPAALVLADYRWESYRALVARWASTVKEIDPLHPVLSGRIPDYAQLLAMPGDVDIVTPDLEPDLVENDLASHNPQAIDIARRAGRFAATPVLSTTPSPGLSPALLARAMPMWMTTALAHGASGLVFSSWDDLADNQPLRLAVAATLQRLAGPDYSELWDEAPLSTAAVLLTPLADGHTLQVGRDGNGMPAGEPRGLYGFGDDLIADEPSNLVYALRWGTAFGAVDYLSPDDVTPAVLSRYSVVLMPQALSVGGDEARALGGYVADGGVLVADLGLGVAQDQWQIMGMGPGLAGLFGIAPPLAVRKLSFNLQSMEPIALFPTFSGSSVAMRTSIALTGGDGPQGAAFYGPVAFSPLPAGTLPLALAVRLPEPFKLNHGHIGVGIRGRDGEPMKPSKGNRPPSTTAFRFLDADVTVHGLGAGFAVYAPFRLWATWRPLHLGFSSFHGDLFARGSAVVQLDAKSFVPAPDGGAPLYPQIVNFSDAIALLSHAPESGNPAVPIAPATKGPDAAPAPGSQFSIVQTRATGSFLWTDGVCSFGTGRDLPGDSAVRPAPVATTDAVLSRPRLVTIYAFVAPQSMRVLHNVPIAVQNLAGGPVIAHIADYRPTGIKLTIWPNATEVLPDVTGIRVALGQPGPVRVSIFAAADDSGYRVLPGSRHRVTITDLAPLASNDRHKKKRDAAADKTIRLVTADPDGVLRLELKAAVASVEVAPL